MLHDGRTGGLTVAIAALGVDAATVIANFNNLSKTDQQNVFFFLRSL